MNTLSTLFAKPIAIFTVNIPPQIVSSKLMRLNKQPFMHNPRVFPESRLEKSAKTNALFCISLGSASAYINLYLDEQNLGQTGIRVSMSRIHGEPLFWSILYITVMSIFGVYFLERNLVGGIILYAGLIVATYYGYSQTIKRQKSDLFILLNKVFPDHIDRKRKTTQSRWSLVKPTPFEFMSSKSIDRISELVRSASQLDIENRRRLIIKQHILDVTDYEAVIQVESSYGSTLFPSVAMSIHAFTTDENDIYIVGELFEVRRANIIYMLASVWNFATGLLLITANLGGSLIIGLILTLVVLLSEKFKPFMKDDINDLTDFIYQTLA